MAARERKFFVGGNWKMNGSKESINRIISFLKEGPLSPESGELTARRVFINVLMTYMYILTLVYEKLRRVTELCKSVRYPENLRLHLPTPTLLTVARSLGDLD